MLSSTIAKNSLSVIASRKKLKKLDLIQVYQKVELDSKSKQ